MEYHSRRTNCQVDEQFGSCEIGSQQGFVAGVVNSIPAYCQAGGILFLVLGAKITDDPAVCGLFVGGDLQFLYEEAHVCAFQISYPLEQTSYFVCKTCFPHQFCCGILDEMLVLQSGACFFADDGANEVVSGKLT
jgi:hypothetical protein